MVASMKPGSVIVDMAASNGGNVEGAVADKKTVTANGVTIIGYTDLAGRLPAQASQLYGTNLVNLMKLLTPGKDGRLVLDFDDVVQRSMTVVRAGEITWPPPPVQVSAAPAAAAAAAPVEVAPAKEPMSTGRRLSITFVAAGLIGELLTRIYYESGGGQQYYVNETENSSETGANSPIDAQHTPTLAAAHGQGEQPPGTPV